MVTFWFLNSLIKSKTKFNYLGMYFELMVLMVLGLLFWPHGEFEGGHEHGHKKKKHHGCHKDKAVSCPAKFLKLGNSCYFISGAKASWKEAHFKCASLSTKKPVTLAVFENKWEDRNIKAFLNHPELGLKDRWIGGIFNWKEAKWQWGPTGALLKYNKKFLQRAVRNKKDFSSWFCIVMNAKRRYNWEADNCQKKKRFICETEPDIRDPIAEYAELQSRIKESELEILKDEKNNENENSTVPEPKHGF